MKTKPNKIIDRSARKLSSILGAFISWLLPPLILIATIESSFADSATWVGGQDGDWNLTNSGGTNWTGDVIPNGPADTATFATSSITSVFLSANTEVNGIVFNAGANQYTITSNGDTTLKISGMGITNNSGMTQHFVTNIMPSTVGAINFTNNATAGNNVTITNNGSVEPGATPPNTSFEGTSSAGSATIINNGGTGLPTPTPVVRWPSRRGASQRRQKGGFGSYSYNPFTSPDGSVAGGSTTFQGTSTADSATITNNGGTGTGAFGGSTTFQGTSTAANATITNNGGLVTGAFGAGGSTTFQETSTAANATITNNGGTGTGAFGGSTTFQGTSTAANATITNNGSGASGAGGGSTTFQDTSHAGNATLIANGGSGGGFGGTISFEGNSTGDTARVEVFAGDVAIASGRLDISVHNAPGVTIGSIEGSGNVFLGAKNLIVGSNNLSTSFSGVIQDGGSGGGFDGSLTKMGTGTLTLTGLNTYTGGTTISTGTLELGTSGGTSGSIVGDVVNNGAFAINRSDTFTFGGVISGAGAFQQLGTGTTVLTGANTYSGGTTISTGTLELGTAGGSGGSIVGDVVNNATFAVNRSDMFTLGGVISGTGAFQQLGTGTTVLTGANTYTGATTVNGGTLMAGAINTLPSQTALTVATGATFDVNNFAQSIGSLAGAGSVTLGPATLTTGSNNTSTDFSGVISESLPGGSLTKVGTGTQTLSGDNTYSGGTTISNGTLQLGNGGTSGSIVGDVVNNATFAVNRSDTFTFGGVISGAGAFQQLGTGTTLLTGANTYTGGTTISAGTLELGTGGGSGGSIVGDVINNATFAVNRSDTFTFGGVISGTGAFQQLGTGTTVLTGANTYTGGTTISAGTLELGTGGGSSGSIVGDVVNNATFAVNRSDTFTFGGVISGAGAFQQLGTGSTVLTGVNTYSGPTMVDAGSLLVDGSLAAASAVTVNSGATLGGTGTAAGAVTIADGGILAPGNSPGTLTVGSLSLGNASLLNYELGTPGVIGSGANDLTIANGNLTLDGVLNTTALAGFGPGGYRLFSYGGALTDNTLNIGTVPPGFSASNFTVITGLPNEVDLLVVAGPVAPLVQFWDGPNTVSNGVIDGGTGNWDNSTTNWTDASGNNNSSWLRDVAVFAGTAGTVTVTQPIFFAGLEFMTSGYRIDQVTQGGIEGSLNLIGSPAITTDAGVTATINATLVGEGGITKEGIGTLILNGENTYTGITTIKAGVLSISSDVNLGIAPPAEVANQLTFNGGTLQATASFDLAANRGITLLSGGGTIGVTAANILSYGGVITGAGSLTKTDTGTLQLFGINTYTGATTVNGGTLAAGAINTLPSQTALTVATGATFNLNNFIQSIGSLAGAGSVTLGTATLITGNNNTSTDFSGVISGLGGLTKVGIGTQTLSGTNTYTGATTVNGGSLAAGAINTLPSQTALTVATGATFDLNNFIQSIGSLAGAGSVTLGTATLTTGNNNTSTDFSGAISGLGGLTKVGTGTQTLSGENTYTGATTVNGGSLAAGAINILPSQTALTVATGATFDLNSFIQSIGSLAGAGSVPLGTATLITGNDNISTIFSGVIQGDVELGGGSLTKVGTGTLTLSGENTYTGATTVNGGSLIVDGLISSPETLVNPGGLLGGNGSLGGNLTNSGIVSPGNSPGTLTVNGNYTQNANGTLHIEIAGIAPGQFDLLAVGGHASLAGTLQLVSLGNFQLQVGDKFTFLTAQGGLSGTFSTIESPFVLIKAQIIYLPNAVQLEGTQGSFTAVACNSNTLAAANALDSAVGDPRASGLIEFLDTQPLSELCGDLELIAPDELPAMFNIGVSLANIQSVNLGRRMEDIRAGSSGFSAKGFSIDSRVPDVSQGLAGPTGPEGKSGPSVMQPTPENRWGVFVTGIGEFTSVDDTSIAPGYNFSTGGLTFGVDYRVSPNFAIGLTGGYAHTNADLVNNGSLDVNGETFGAYATGFAGGFYVDAAVFGVFNGYDSHRTALLGTASGDTNGSDFNALATAGYDWKRGDLTVGPLASFQYTYVGLDGFTEHGSLAPLSFNDQNTESTRTALGAKASYDWHVGHVVVKPELRAAWQHEFGDTDYSIVSRFASGAGNSFAVNGPAIGRDSLLIGAGAAVMFNDRVSVYAYYDGELARTNYSSNGVSAGLRFTF